MVISMPILPHFKNLHKARLLDAEDVDTDLIRRAREGDFKSVKTIVEKYQNRIYALGLRITGRSEDAEEVAQGTFLNVIQHLKDFRGESKFSTWLYRIAANQAIKLVEARRRHQTKELVANDSEETFAEVPLPNYTAPWTSTPEALVAGDETRRILNDALEELDEKHRAVFYLRDAEGLSTEETAEALGLSIANVKVRLMRARLMLREILTEKFGDAKAALLGHDHDHRDH